MKLNFDTDVGSGPRANMGLVILETDETLEPEFMSIMNISGVALYHCRISMVPTVNSQTLAKMEHDLPDAVGKLPSATPFNVIGYACTSASSVIGSDRISEVIQETFPNTKVTDPLESILASLKHLGAKNIGFVTPYVQHVSEAMRNRLENAGINIVAFGSFEEGDDRVVARISEASIKTATEKVAEMADCDAIVIACTNLRSFGIISSIEDTLGIPVVSSNQALAWRMLRLAGVSDSLPKMGKLLA